MKPRYEYGDEVRLIRNVRNDGTYPGLEIGDFLVKRGSLGYVQDVGTYLQDQLIYKVHFVEADKMVGCREEELIAGDDPWNPSAFEFRDKVTCSKSLSVNGEVIVEHGTQGEVLKVLRDLPGGVQYHVRFPGKTLQVPESVLAPLAQDDEANANSKKKVAKP
jgi:nitrogen fixation protein NifZ